MKELIQNLGLEQHPEGGYFKLLYTSSPQRKIQSEYGERNMASAIHYMVTEKQPINYWHKSRSDILYCYHSGNSYLFRIIDENGKYEEMVLGPNQQKGEKLFISRKGGTWKSSILLEGQANYCLISEVVVPGFDWKDYEYGRAEELKKLFPNIHQSLFEKFCKPEQ